MRPARTIQSTWLIMLIVQTIGSVGGAKKLPAPRQFVAISVLWGMLFVMADTGMGKLAARLSMLTLLTASVVGPFGQRFIDFLNTVGRSFATGGGTPGTTGVTGVAGQEPSQQQPINP